jgi:hypothetical protein
MDRKRSDIEHDIWVAAYLTALCDSSPEVAEQCAIDAIKRYQVRWGRSDAGGSFVETLRRREFRPIGGQFSDLNFGDEPE